MTIPFEDHAAPWAGRQGSLPGGRHGAPGRAEVTFQVEDGHTDFGSTMEEEAS